MDELELLKQKWQDREQELPKLSYNDIYKMLLKKSSSVVKWIFIISICELLFWIGISLLIPESQKEFNNQMGLKTVFLISSIVGYVIIAVFLYIFYRNYTRIRVTDSAKELMKNILRTRKTVKYFVIYNIGMSAVILIAVNLYYYFNIEKLQTLVQEQYGANSSITQDQFATMFFGAQIVAGIIMIAFLLLFYWLIYGLLLRRLKRNYNELKKIEV